MTSVRPVTVLVPNELGERTLTGLPGVTVLRYAPGEPWPTTDAGDEAVVLVVTPFDSDDIGPRLPELASLSLVQTLNAGFEQWLEYLPDGVLLANGRGAHGGSSAEWVMAALLAIYRDLRSFAAAQEASRWDAHGTETLIGKRVLVLGAGDLAENLAARLRPFEVEVTLFGRTARDGVSALADVGASLGDADAVVAMLPETDETHHLIDAAFLAALPDGAVVVNAGRGGAVDPKALLAELTAGRLRAALDVTEPEPLPAGDPLWTAPGLLLTPHVAGNTAGAWERAWAVARRQIEEFTAGRTPPNVVAGSPR